MPYYYYEMSDPEVDALIDSLRNWCQEKRGRNVEIAKMLGVSKQLVSDWFSGHSVPTLSSGLKIQSFLKKQRRPSKN